MMDIWKSTSSDFEEKLKNRIFLTRDFEDPKQIQVVQKILDEVRIHGDQGLYRCIAQFEKRENPQNSIHLTNAAKKRLLKKVDPKMAATLKRCAQSIKRYHQNQRKHSDKPFSLKNEKGVQISQRVTPLNRVALYVPGGLALYPSSVLMNAIPAQVAGVRERVLFTPPRGEDPDPHVVYAAELVGIKEIVLCGGAHAIAAAAFGTETIEKVDKIVGPGNIYVTLAKRLVFGRVDIDMLAGPSEVLVVADHSANAQWIAWDLLAQAEHDPFARPLCITPSEKLAREVNYWLGENLKELHRRDIAEKSCKDRGALIVVRNLKEAARLSDRIAPEHLEIQCQKPEQFLNQVQHFGAAFVGPFTPEAVGDYIAGPSHVLPTCGSARFASPLGVGDFLKRSSILKFSFMGLKRIRTDVERMAELEGLEAHGKSVKFRFKELYGEEKK